jgi:hypothetical protein
MMHSESGKGDAPRPCCTGREENEVRKALAYGEITRKEFDARMAELEAAGLVYRR